LGSVGVLKPEAGYAQIQKVSFEQLDSIEIQDVKNVFLFIRTDWCKYCHKMDHTTLKNETIVKLLTDHFYFIELDAESKTNIKYQGRTFKYKPTGNDTGVHELAKQLGTINGKLNYPALVVLNTKNEIVFQYDGYLNAKELEAILKENLQKM
jgi:thioredoxin-related protein